MTSRRAKQGARRGIQSVEIGLRVIEALRRAAGPQTLKELALNSNIPPSNCHRYLVSFVRAGFVSQDPGSGRYDFGAGLLQAGLAALARVDAVSVGTAALTRLVDVSGHTGLLAIWSELGAVIVRWMPGRLAVRTTLSTGSTLPLLSSATGRIFLAINFIVSGGTSDSSVTLLLPRTATYASIFFIRASSWLAMRFDCLSEASSASARFTRA